jgi:ATP-dependent RNA helicase RhlE
VIDFGTLLSDVSLVERIKSAGWKEPTPIQAAAIPVIREKRDVLGIAMTGSGKTGAYLLPIVERLHGADKATAKRPNVLILVPTRELAQQVGEVFRMLAETTSLTAGIVYGGVGYAHQRKSLANGIHVMIATPGRLIDLMDQGHCLLDRVNVFVLDEADRMLDMGFQPAIEAIEAKLPKERQSLFFSATFPPLARRLATKMLDRPVEVAVDAPSTIVTDVEQHLLPVAQADKQALLYDLLNNQLPAYSIGSAFVFTNSRVQAGRVSRYLTRRELSVAPIHGGMSQGARDEVLRKLRSGEVKALIATDVLARGIDIDELSFVINYDVPLTVEAYVHRIGRTARAGKSGVSLTFAAVSEVDLVADIEEHIDQRLKIDSKHPYAIELPIKAPPKKRKTGATTKVEVARGVEVKQKKTSSGKTISVEYKAGNRRRSISGKISSGKSRRKTDDKYKPAWKKGKKQ